MRRTGKHSLYLALALVILCSVHVSALAGEFSFETGSVRYAIGDDGFTKSLLEKGTGRELIASPAMPFAAIRKGGKYFPATGVRLAGNGLRVEFSQSGVSAEYRVTAGQDSIVLELVRIEGTGVEEVRLSQLRVGGMANIGTLLSVAWDEKFALCLLALTDGVESRFDGGLLVASVYPEHGMTGEKVGLIAGPTKRFASIVQKIEKEYRLPSPSIGGVWAKESPDSRTSYLFTDLNEANVDETIRYAKLAGFKYILIYSHIWSSSVGSYPVNIAQFPHGEEGLRKVIEKCHAAGLKVGMHMMTGFIGKQDPLVREHPGYVASDAVTALATDIDDSIREITASGTLSTPAGIQRFGASSEVRIDDEIIHYQAVGGPSSTTFLKCIRGYAGTRAAPHRAGTKIYHLAEYVGSYLADLRTRGKDAIAERIAGLIDRCGFDMIFFDGGEGGCVNGPCWYWAGQQQMSIWKRVKRDLLVEGSAVTPWTWHISTRGYCDDYTVLASKQYLDTHKIADRWQFYRKNMMSAELGWWGLLSSTPDHAATMPDEAEFYGVRMLALDAPVSLQTSLKELRSNGRSEEILKVLGTYEQLRLGKSVTAIARERLLTGEWHLMVMDGRSVLRTVRYDVQRTDAQGTVIVKNDFAPQKLKFRLQATQNIAAVGDPSNIALLPAGRSLTVAPPGPAGLSPGMLAAKVGFSGQQSSMPMFGQGSSMVEGGAPRDLTSHRALAITIKVEGPTSPASSAGAVLNVQLESGGAFRDHFIDLDFSGERTIILPEPDPKRMLTQLRPASTAYSFQSALYGFDYRNVTAVNIRWMRLTAGKPISCIVTRIEALTEKDAAMTEPEITVNARSIVVPVTLRNGDYVEYWGEGQARVFDRNGVQLSVQRIADVPFIESGQNKVLIRGKGNAGVRLTTILTGPELSL